MLFKDLHPNDEKIPYVLFKLAESYYQQVPSTHDRDLANAVKAISLFEELKALYPQNEYLKDVDKKIKKCKSHLRKKEQYIADFYFKTDVFLAAKIRYLRILRLYKNDPDAVDMINHSILRIVESTHNLKEYKRCLKYGGHFKRLLRSQDREQFSKTIDSCRKALQEKASG